MQAQDQVDPVPEKVREDRLFFETLGQLYPAEERVNSSRDTVSGVVCFWFDAGQKECNKMIIYLHGGSFALGSIHSHKAMVSHFAKAVNLPVLFIEYSLAPEHPFPFAVNEVVSVYEEVKKRYPGKKIYLMGDSAGGGLVVSAVHTAREKGLPFPDGIVLISPWLNLACNTGSYRTRQKLDPIFTKESLLPYAHYYAGENLKNASPSELRFAAFPPVFLLVGSNEVLYDDTKNFYDYIVTVQNKSRMKEYGGCTHVWPLTNIHSNGSKEAMNDIRDFLLHRLNDRKTRDKK